MRRGRCADQHHRPVPLQECDEGVKVVRCGHGVDDQVEALRVRGHLIGIARYHHLVGAERPGVLALGFGRGEGDHMRAHRVGELDAHVPQPADADHAHLLARTGLPVPQRRIGGDARAQQRRHRGELVFRMRDPQHIALVHHDPLRIAAERVAGRVGRRGIVGADHAVAIVLQPVRAVVAPLATVDDAADADEIALAESRHLRADRRDAAHDLVAGNARPARARPFRARLMQIRMADAAIDDLDLNVVRTGRPARDLHRFEGAISGIGAVGLHGHRSAPWFLTSFLCCQDGTPFRSL